MNINYKSEAFLYAAMQKNGIPFPHNESLCGMFVRWGRNYRYWLISVFDGYKFGDFVSGEEFSAFPEKTHVKGERNVHQRDITHVAKETERIQNEQWKSIAKKANKIWESAQYCCDHDYLKKKNVPSVGLRVVQTKDKYPSKYINNNIIYNDDIYVPLSALIVPIYSSDNNIVSLQYIYQNGNKRFLKGGRKHGCYFPIGYLKRRIFFAEGYATACSIFMATGELSICCFDAGNLKPVAEKFRKFHPTTEIIICADNDSVGLSKAIETGKSIDAVTVFPVFHRDFANLTDFNDLANLEGIATVKQQISNAFMER